MKVFLTQLRAHSHDFRKNFDAVIRIVESSQSRFSSEDVLLLPELVGGESAREQYESFTSDLARGLGCYVVAGSHHDGKRERRINRGAVADPTGAIVSRYDKLRPYGIESQLGIGPGSATGNFDIAGCRVLVLVCADFWYSGVFLSLLNPRPDLILVPTFSISLRDSPRAARPLWRSMAVSRAYEFGVYVGISDWAYPSEYHGLKSSSVAGLADPRPREHDGFFSRLGRRSVAGYPVDLDRLREFREHRESRAFLSDEALTGNIPIGNQTRGRRCPSRASCTTGC